MGEKYLGYMSKDEKALFLSKILRAKNLKERAQIQQNEYSKIPLGGSTKDFNEVGDLADKLQGLNKYDPTLPKAIEKLRLALAELIKKPSVAHPITPTGGMGVQRQGLHAPTMAEIIAKGSRRDPTSPYFNTNSDFMREINPLEPHYNLGDFPKLVNPLKPGPKTPTNG